MLGKSVGAVAVCLVFAIASCARNVPQDVATGPDGKIKGAKPIEMQNGEGKANGIVTYPGGDRVDWKEVDLPDKIVGVLDLKLQWQPPRPGLQLAFDVFDEWNTPIVTSKKAGKHSRARIRTATVENAKGKYFIRVYAPGRGDAGKYKLTVDFKEGAGSSTVDWKTVEIPDPPKLAALPEVVEPCDDTNFDPKKNECKSFCPAAGAPPNWPGCKGKCPDPPDPTNQACWDKVCPNPPTMKAKACKISNFPPCAPDAPDPDNPRCNVKANPVTGRIVENKVSGSDVLITIAVGSDNGVQKTWKGAVLQGTTDSPLAGGEVTVIRVDKKATLGKVHLNIDQLESNSRVKLSPP
ncbi:MAG: hypothetical protein JO257_22650 [Deltaproteobacteria bacterium]|nr:hypothetical protein [Deltaproteobacteria bacterium]